MLSTIEKIIILKTVDSFAEVPDNILAEVTAFLREVELQGGETLFKKGDPGDCMYIIVSGEVRVHIGANTLNHLTEGDVFGEMAVLDSETRVASVTAVDDTLLLRLDQESYYDLMADRIEITRGIIRVLAFHLRNRDQDITKAKAQLREFEENPI